VYATFKMRGVPANVNYRYLEDELAYLIDNSDAEALLFHGELGDRVAKIHEQAPNVKAWIQIDDGAPLQDFAIGYEELLAAHDPMPGSSARATTSTSSTRAARPACPRAVMWRNEDLIKVLIDSAYQFAGAQPPDTPAGSGAIAKAVIDAGSTRMHLPASPLMHGTGAFTSFQAMFVGTGIVTLENRHFDAHELWQTVQRERITSLAIVGDAFAKPMVRALEEAEAKGAPYDISSVQIIISSGVMWSTETKQALMSRGNIICYDSLGSSEGVGFAGSINVPGSEPKTAKFTIGEHTKVFTDDGARSSRIRRDRHARGRRAHPCRATTRTRASRRRRSARSTARAGRFRATSPASRPTARSCCSGRGSACINSGGEKVYPEEVEEP
jgi:fatty-acyl-CoA synthase